VDEITSGPRFGATPGLRPEAIKAIPVRHTWRWVSAVLVLAVAADVVFMIVQAIGQDVTSVGTGWVAVGRYLFGTLILRGIIVTLELTVLAMAIGVGLGIVLAVMRLSPNPVVSWVSWLYIWFFRGTPVLVQIFFWFNLNIVLKNIGLGFPGTPFFLLLGHTNSLINPFIAATLGLGLNEAAYMAEIVRAGIISVEHGQTEAAQALGMTRLLVMRRIVLPQAMRVIIPPTGNETISMLKTTSLVAFIALSDLFYTVTLIYSSNYKTIPLLLVASIWYLVFTSVLTVGQAYIERYFGRGSTREASLTLFQRIRRNFWPHHAAVTGPPAQVDADVHRSGEDHR